MEDNPPERSSRLKRALPVLFLPNVAALVAAATLFVSLQSTFSLAVAQAAAPAASVTAPFPLLSLVWLFLLLLLSAFLSTSQTALTTVGEWRLKQLREESGDPGGLVARLEHSPARFITTLLIGNTAVNAAIAALLTSLALRQAEAWGYSDAAAVSLAITVAGLAILLFCELAPKSVAAHDPVRVTRLVLRPVFLLSIVLYPLGIAFNWLTSQVLRVFKIEPTRAALMSETELKHMLQNAEESGVIEAQEQAMIRGVIDLEMTVVREVMTPRVDLVGIAGVASLPELQALVTEHGYSRLPVYGEGVDDIKGMVYARDLLPYLGRTDLASTRVFDIMTAVQYVPETLSLMSLLREMRLRKNHLAVVVDEFGGTSGVVTLEDIIEEITGEIYDETDEDEVEDVVPLEDGSFRLQGGTHIETIADKLKLTFDPNGDYDTVAGFLIDNLDHIPLVGEEVVLQGVRFVVEQADERRVISVVATPRSEPDAPVLDRQNERNGNEAAEDDKAGRVAIEAAEV